MPETEAVAENLESFDGAKRAVLSRERGGRRAERLVELAGRRRWWG